MSGMIWDEAGKKKMKMVKENFEKRRKKRKIWGGQAKKAGGLRGEDGREAVEEREGEDVGGRARKAE